MPCISIGASKGLSYFACCTETGNRDARHVGLLFPSQGEYLEGFRLNDLLKNYGLF